MITLVFKGLSETDWNTRPPGGGGGGGGTPLFGHYGNAPLNKVWFSGS